MAETVVSGLLHLDSHRPASEKLMKKQILLSIAASSIVLALSQTAVAQTAARPADNTESNRTDPSNRRSTADAQRETESDRALTQRIRKNVIADSSLSTYAHNIKIVSINGSVTLNGVVRSTAEKTTLEKIAVDVAGKEHVMNSLKVEPAN